MTYLKKFLINLEQGRKNPRFFSWVDRAFMQEGYLQQLCHEGIMLYFFFIMVSDRQGLSFYSDKSVRGILKLDKQSLNKARRQLQIQGLIAYEYPIYQVLSLEQPNRERNSAKLAVRKEPQSVKTIMTSSFNKLLSKKNTKVKRN